MADAGAGKYTATVDLTEGVHFYKFVVDGEKWEKDPNGDKELEGDDGNGGKNSALLIGPDARKLPPAKPNAICEQAVAHDPNDMADCNVATDKLLRLRICTQADDVPIVRAIYEAEPGVWKKQAMWKIETKMGFDHFGTMISVTRSPIRYIFELTDGTTTKYLAKGKLFDSMDTAIVSAYSVEMTPKFQTPDWAKHAVWYQIFPERFRNGDPSNDPGDKPYEHLVKWQAKWFAAAEGEVPGDENFYKGAGNVWKRRYGGDVQGLIQALPYMKSLGINAIYLNPMFEADSMHKYDTTDYRHIDEHFGFKGDIAEAWKTETDDPATWTWTKTDRLFLDFVAKAHAMGFKVILDGVFNHVGRSYWAFQDVLKKGKDSKYADWFDIRDWNPPIKYIAWDKGSEPSTDGSLPIFKKNPETGLGDGPKRHIFAITKRWLGARWRSKQGRRWIPTRCARRHPAPLLDRVAKARQIDQARRLHLRRNLGLGTGLVEQRRSVRRGDELSLCDRVSGFLCQSDEGDHAHAIRCTTQSDYLRLSAADVAGADESV